MQQNTLHQPWRDTNGSVSRTTTQAQDSLTIRGTEKGIRNIGMEEPPVNCHTRHTGGVRYPLRPRAMMPTPIRMPWSGLPRIFSHSVPRNFHFPQTNFMYNNSGQNACAMPRVFHSLAHIHLPQNMRTPLPVVYYMNSEVTKFPKEAFSGSVSMSVDPDLRGTVKGPSFPGSVSMSVDPGLRGTVKGPSIRTKDILTPTCYSATYSSPRLDLAVSPSDIAARSETYHEVKTYGQIIYTSKKPTCRDQNVSQPQMTKAMSTDPFTYDHLLQGCRQVAAQEIGANDQMSFQTYISSMPQNSSSRPGSSLSHISEQDSGIDEFRSHSITPPLELTIPLEDMTGDRMEVYSSTDQSDCSLGSLDQSSSSSEEDSEIQLIISQADSITSPKPNKNIEHSPPGSPDTKGTYTRNTRTITSEGSATLNATESHQNALQGAVHIDLPPRISRIVLPVHAASKVQLDSSTPGHLHTLPPIGGALGFGFVRKEDNKTGTSDPHASHPGISDLLSSGGTLCNSLTHLELRSGQALTENSDMSSVVSPAITQHTCALTESSNTVNASESHKTQIASEKQANKLNAKSVAVLTEWYEKHEDHPYPSPADKLLLAQESSITVAQVTQWFANKRFRLTQLQSKKRKRTIDVLQTGQPTTVSGQDSNVHKPKRVRLR